MKKTPSACATLVPRRRRLTRALLVLGLAFGAIALTPQRVDAAGAIVSCFFRGGPNPTIVSGFPVELWGVNQFGNPQQVGAAAYTDSRGCATFIILPPYQNWYLYTQINYFGGDARYYHGYNVAAYYWWQPTNQFYDVGTFYTWPGNHVWVTLSVLECQQSWPVPLTPC
jgi:hypothetical protein